MNNLKKFILISAFLFVGFFAKSSFAEAASRFWVGGTGNWDASDTSHWSASSGGASGASVPGSGDTATLDASSGGGTVTVTAAVTTDSITMGAFTGTFDMNGQTFTLTTFSVTGTGTRTLTMGSSTINLGAGCFTASTASNLTITSNTATITCSSSGATFTTATLNYNGVSVVMSGTGQASVGAGVPTFANFTRTGTASKTDSLFITSGITVTGTLNLNGNSSTNRLLVSGSGLGSTRNITNTGATMSWSNVDFRDIDLATAYDCSAITGLCGDAGGNVDFTFTTATTTYWIGGAGNWSDVNEWASTSGGSAASGRVPLAQDSVIFDNNSFSGTQTVTIDMPRIGKDVDWSAYNEGATPVIGGTAAATIYGSITMNSGVNFTFSGAWTFEGRGTHTVTLAGDTFNSTVNFNAFGGTYTMLDAYSSNGNQTNLNNGTFDANDFSITNGLVASTNSNVRTIHMGTGTWTVTSTGNVWNFGTVTNLTLNEETSTIVVSNTTSTSKTFIGGGETYYILTILGDNVITTGNNTVNTLNLNNPNYTNGTKFTGASTTTITSLFSSNATSTSARVVATSTNASLFELKFTGGGTVCEDYMDIARMLGTPASTWYVGANSLDSGNNSGITFTACPGAPAATTERRIIIIN